MMALVMLTMRVYLSSSDVQICRFDLVFFPPMLMLLILTGVGIGGWPRRWSKFYFSLVNFAVEMCPSVLPCF